MNVRVTVMPKEGILDPQGAAVERALPALGFQSVSNVRIGKLIELSIEPAGDVSEERLRAMVDDMCRKLLANPIIEDFMYEFVEE